MKTEPAPETEFPDLPQNERDEIVKRAIEAAGHYLLSAMMVCKAENFIEGTVVNMTNNIAYDLRLKKHQPQPEDKTAENTESLLEYLDNLYLVESKILPMYEIEKLSRKAMELYATQVRNQGIQEAIELHQKHRWNTWDEIQSELEKLKK